MDPEKLFTKIKSFLNKHHYLHELEVLDRYGTKIPEFYHTLTTELSKMSSEDLIAIENHAAPKAKLSEELNHFISECQSLIDIPKRSINSEHLNPILKRKLTPKKEHEIININAILKDSKIQNFIDIGSGAGHLSSILVDGHADRKSLCIDANQNYQQIGIDKLKKWAPGLLKKISFKTQLVDQNHQSHFFLF